MLSVIAGYTAVINETTTVHKGEGATGALLKQASAKNPNVLEGKR
jgi:hypothetical protein